MNTFNKDIEFKPSYHIKNIRRLKEIKLVKDYNNLISEIRRNIIIHNNISKK